MLTPDANDTGLDAASEPATQPATPPPTEPASGAARTGSAQATAAAPESAERHGLRTVACTTERLLVTSVDDREVAQRLARALVEARLASCVQCVQEVVSCYRWQGEVCESPEQVLWIKTAVDHLPAIATLFQELHPYSCAEFVSIAPSELSAPFAEWWTQHLKAGEG